MLDSISLWVAYFPVITRPRWKKNGEKATKPKPLRRMGLLAKGVKDDWTPQPPPPASLSPKPYCYWASSDIPSSVWRTTKAVVQLVSWHVSAHGRCKHCHDELFNKEKAKSFGVVRENNVRVLHCSLLSEFFLIWQSSNYSCCRSKSNLV